jgi:hypothetical protein
MLDASAALMEGALHLARDEEDLWQEGKCLTWLAIINFERAEPEATLANREERPLAVTMGESGEPPFVLAMEALARLKLGHPNATANLEVAVELLRAFDSKAHVAYVLNAAAGIAFKNRNFTAALALPRSPLSRWKPLVACANRSSLAHDWRAFYVRRVIPLVRNVGSIP